jgi:hypothetical protein
MKYASDRPFADPEKSARKIVEIANATEAVQHGRIHVEEINGRVRRRAGACDRQGPAVAT